MAKSILSTPTKTERDKFIKSVIEGEMARYDKDSEQIAAKAKFTSKTLRTKLDNPGEFKLKELYAIMDALNVRVAFIRKPQPL